MSVVSSRQIDDAGGVPYKPRHSRALGPKRRSIGAEDRRDMPATTAQSGVTGPISSALAEWLRETDLPAEQTGAQAPPRLSCPHGDQGRPQGGSRTPRARTQTAQRITGARPFKPCLARPCLAKPCTAMERLKRRTDFRAAASGSRAPNSAFVLQARRRGDMDGARVGFTVSRQVGNAVERNRVRRRLREVVRLATSGSLHEGHDYVLIGRRGALSLPFAEMIRALDAALRRIHAQKPEATGDAPKRPLHDTGSPAPARRPTPRRKPPIHER
jgi:ribonuclease P protein component